MLLLLSPSAAPASLRPPDDFDAIALWSPVAGRCGAEEQERRHSKTSGKMRHTGVVSYENLAARRTPASLPRGSDLAIKIADEGIPCATSEATPSSAGPSTITILDPSSCASARVRSRYRSAGQRL